MKKIYQKPETLVIEVMTQAMIAASEKLPTGGNYSGGAIGAKNRGDEYTPEEETTSFGDLW